MIQLQVHLQLPCSLVIKRFKKNRNDFTNKIVKTNLSQMIRALVFTSFVIWQRLGWKFISNSLFGRETPAFLNKNTERLDVGLTVH